MVIGAAIGFSIAAIFFVTYKQHDAADKYKRHRQEYCAAFTTSTEQKEACTEETASANDYLPWGYKLVAWPESITTWAIIFTGFAVVWQAWGTGKAARATQVSVQLVIAKERARIAVDFPPNALDLDDGPEWTEGMNVVYAGTQIIVANLGGANAFNVIARAEIIGTPDGGALGSDEVSVLNLPAVLKPNTNPISVEVITLLKGINHVAAVKNGFEILHLVGTITYDDIFGNSYETQFRYLWEVDSTTIKGKKIYVPRWQRTAEGNRAT